mmetsp:Transcript_9492/g.27924  ORF Transcript_9492/g.27924 Transcript_9492/m.27924 type:complete len:254 (-) Transcript_9492:91-852(-)
MRAAHSGRRAADHLLWVKGERGAAVRVRFCVAEQPVRRGARLSCRSPPNPSVDPAMHELGVAAPPSRAGGGPDVWRAARRPDPSRHARRGGLLLAASRLELRWAAVGAAALDDAPPRRREQHGGAHRRDDGRGRRRRRRGRGGGGGGRGHRRGAGAWLVAACRGVRRRSGRQRAARRGWRRHCALLAAWRGECGERGTARPRPSIRRGCVEAARRCLKREKSRPAPGGCIMSQCLPVCSRDTREPKINETCRR